MNYFKIIEDGRVVDAGEIFLRWQEKNHILISCPLEEAQLVQSHDGETIYRVPWLNPLPEDAGSYESAEAAVIDRQEYLDLLAVLEDGEQPVEPEPPKQEPEPEPEPVLLLLPPLPVLLPPPRLPSPRLLPPEEELLALVEMQM